MLNEQSPLLLASGSPRRRQFIEQLNLPFVTCRLEIDESPRGGEKPSTYVGRIAEDKLAEARRVASATAPSPGAILTADTAVVLGAEIMGKPVDDKDALRMLRRLSGKTHEVLSAFALLDVTRNKTVSRMVCTALTFRDASDSELHGYVATGEGRDKAGSYAIQGIGAFLVEAIHGSYSNVVGLPLCELVVELKQLGLLGRYP